MSSESSHAATALRYRPHIDGLRAIAVLAVIFYHAKLLGVTGGFVGVDIFFVISGFLITSIIVRDLRAGTFSLLAFWERRIRRILPALTVVMLCTIIAAYFIILYPYDYHHFGSSVIMQSVFASNVLFMVSDSYFDPAVSSFSPLLHTWTLSVEEQFYLLFPFVVLLCAWLAGRRRGSSDRSDANDTSRKRERILLVSVIAISAASFLLNVYLVHVRPGTVINDTFLDWYNPVYYANAGFYLILSRAWELGLGAALALLSWRVRRPQVAETVAVAGMASIFGSIFLLNDTTSFPGIAALLPTLGAAAIIVANDHVPTKIGRVLSYSWLVWIGLISYSLYLWHWPVLVFARIVSPSVTLDALSTIGLIVLVFIISWLSYRFVETPFRNKKGMVKSRKMVLALGFGSMALLALLGVLIYRNHLSNEGRIPSSANTTLSLLAASRETLAESPCFHLPGDESKYGGLCRIGNASSKVTPRFVVMGDSHTQMLIPLFDALGRGRGVQGVVFWDSGCIPVIGISPLHPKESCFQEVDNALSYIRDKDIKNVFIVASWSSYVMGGPRGERQHRVAEPGSMSNSPEQAQNVLQKHLSSMVQELASEGRTIYIMKQVPQQSFADPRSAFYKAIAMGKEIPIQGISISTNAAYRQLADEAIDAVAKIPRVQAIDPSRILCEKSGCPVRRGETLLYRDNDHVSLTGAMLLKPLFTPIFAKIY